MCAYSSFFILLSCICYDSVGFLRSVTKGVYDNIATILAFIQTPWDTNCIKLSKFLKPFLPVRFKLVRQLFIPSKSFHPTFLHQHFCRYNIRRQESKRIINSGSFLQHVPFCQWEFLWWWAETKRKLVFLKNPHYPQTLSSTDQLLLLDRLLVCPR